MNGLPWFPQWLASAKSVSYFYRDVSHTTEIGQPLRGLGLAGLRDPECSCSEFRQQAPGSFIESLNQHFDRRWVVRLVEGQAAHGEGRGGALLSHVVGSIPLCGVVLRVAGYLLELGGRLLVSQG